jgi:dimeric dUTPase (all-alpha-NTP-PPase superfamily)
MMDFRELYNMQRYLDEKIVKQHGLEKKTLVQKRILALYVEIGELANETRCFKFWSLKPSNTRDKILEEYVDGIHFILSLGISLSFEKVQLKVNEPVHTDLVQQFSTVFQAVARFDKEKKEKNFLEVFENYVILGQKLSFSFEEIVNAYKRKNEVNIERQENGY